MRPEPIISHPRLQRGPRDPQVPAHLLLRRARSDHRHSVPLELIGVDLRHDCHPSSTTPPRESCGHGLNRTPSSPPPASRPQASRYETFSRFTPSNSLDGLHRTRERRMEVRDEPPGRHSTRDACDPHPPHSSRVCRRGDIELDESMSPRHVSGDLDAARVLPGELGHVRGASRLPRLRVSSPPFEVLTLICADHRRRW